MNHQEIITLESQMQAGTEAEKAHLADYLENKKIPIEYLDYCRAWERAYFKWERLVTKHNGGEMHKNYCGYPGEPCNCGYYDKQKEHRNWCGYPKDPCSCNKGLSQADIDKGKDKKRG